MHLMHLTSTIVCITQAYRTCCTIFWTYFAPIMSHEISLISCDYCIKSQNIVWTQKNISLRGDHDTLKKLKFYICTKETSWDKTFDLKQQYLGNKKSYQTPVCVKFLGYFFQNKNLNILIRALQTYCQLEKLKCLDLHIALWPH